jgi:hypothetical protein
LPALLEIGEDKAEEVIREAFVAWISRTEILVHLCYRYCVVPVCRCRVLRLDGEDGPRWIRPGGRCPEPGMLSIHGFESSKEGLLVISSTGEGHPDVTIARFDSKEGYRKWGAPEFDLYPFGPLGVRFPGGSDLWFLTPCRLGERPRPCIAVDHLDSYDAGYPCRLYRWSAAGRSLRLVRRRVPMRVDLDPRTGLMVWPRPGKVCFGDPDRPRTAVCRGLPR